MPGPDAFPISIFMNSSALIKCVRIICSIKTNCFKIIVGIKILYFLHHQRSHYLSQFARFAPSPPETRSSHPRSDKFINSFTNAESLKSVPSIFPPQTSLRYKTHRFIVKKQFVNVSKTIVNLPFASLTLSTTK